MIPAIYKGKGITGALAYCMGQGNDADTGERKALMAGEASRATLLGGQNFGFEIDSAERLELARRMLEWQAFPENLASRTKKVENDCFHAALSWNAWENPTAEEMTEAARSFLKSVGMEKARAVFIAHDDTDHKHLHVVASTVDPETRRAIPLFNDFIKAQGWAAEWDQAHGQTQGEGRKLPALIEAVKLRHAEAVIDYLTRDKATFQHWELNRALVYGGLNETQRAEFSAEILAHRNVIGLRETAESPVMRYTTRAVLASEMELLREAGALAAPTGHGLNAAIAESTRVDFTLKPEQAAAFDHLTQDSGFAMLWGEAGTGKSHTLNATRAAYEAQGFRVLGMAWTNDVVQQMRGDGFNETATIASELKAVEEGRSAWTDKTIVIVDEAAMVSTDNLARLAHAASQSGAKLILAGDDKQLSSIERGGMFETLRQTHGAAILSEVQRVKDAEQQRAFNGMHQGDFLSALQTFEKAGGLHWSSKQSDTLKAMAERYTADLAADPDKRRFMFAHTNKDVATLNEHARALHRQRGALGEDRSLATAQGEKSFATGDRIQFTGNGRKKAERNAGLVNGRVGTITAIETIDGRQRVTVALDAKTGEQAPHVRFVVGENARAGEFNQFKHGYAGTIYRGQGRTLDEVYVGHSKQWRASAAYVALTRHRERVHIFAARETAKNVEAMAKGMARADNKRAATAFQIDEGSALRIDFDEVGRVATRIDATAPAPRLSERVRAFLEAERQQRAQREQQRSLAPSQPQETPRGTESVSAADKAKEIAKTEFSSREARKAALQELKRLFGREVNEQEGKEITQQRGRDRGGGQSL